VDFLFYFWCTLRTGDRDWWMTRVYWGRISIEWRLVRGSELVGPEQSKVSPDYDRWNIQYVSSKVE
jgi:hypothetical protein